MAAGQELRVIAALGRQIQGLIDRRGPLVGEWCGDQPGRLSLAAPSLAAVSTALTML